MKIKTIKHAIIISALSLAQSGLHGQDVKTEQQHIKVLTIVQKEQSLALAKEWVSRLWATNDAYYGGRISLKELARGASPVWTHHRGIWTNGFLEAQQSVYQEKAEEAHSWNYVVVDLIIPVSNRTEQCVFKFVDEKADSPQLVRNNMYCDPNIPCRKDGKPVHTTEAQAREKAGEYAALFGISNLWDKTQFMLRSPGFTRGNWNFNLTPNINGYPTLYPIVISLADLPGLPLGRWINCMDQIPTNLPTNVVLTASQARAKAEEYLKKYFPLKAIIPKMTFNTNCLEYVSPNYNYIRPADETGFSNYMPKKDEVALVWKNYFDKPRGLSFSLPAIIYVDAATGEMLGGSD